MNSTGDSIATPLVRGTIAAAISLGTAIALVVVPALAAQVAGSRSSATALDAIIIALNVLVLGHGGGIVLSTGVIDGAVTLTPFGLLGLLLLISTLGMRRVGRALELVRDDGVLRLRALRDAGGALGAYTAVYAIGMAVLAGIGRSTDTSPMVTSAIVSGAMVAVLGGVLGILWSLRREATSTIPGVRVLELLPAPFGDVARAVLIALLGLLSAGMLLSVVMMVLSVREQSALFDGLDPGIIGAIVLTLVQLALLPLLAVWALVVLLGGTVGVGASSSISLDGSATGVMPALPLLGAFPGPGDFPGWAWLLLVVPAVPVALGALRLVRDVEGLQRRDRITAWVAYPVAVLVGVLLLAGLSTGGIGEGRLVHLGPQTASLVLPLLGVVVISTGLVLVVYASPAVAWASAQIAALRAKVERAELSERSDGGAGPTGSGDVDVDVDVDGDAGAAGAAGADSDSDSGGRSARADDGETSEDDEPGSTDGIDGGVSRPSDR